MLELNLLYRDFRHGHGQLAAKQTCTVPRTADYRPGSSTTGADLPTTEPEPSTEPGSTEYASTEDLLLDLASTGPLTASSMDIAFSFCTDQFLLPDLLLVLHRCKDNNMRTSNSVIIFIIRDNKIILSKYVI